MTRKRCHRRPIVPVPPRGLRPTLAPDQVRDLALCHLVHVDAIASGQADAETLWQWAGGVLTWSRVAELSPSWDDSAREQMKAGLDLVQAVADRWIRTGRVGFTGPELVAARQLVELQDAMAEAVDRPTAIRAADWSEATLSRVRLAAMQRRQQALASQPAERLATDQAQPAQADETPHPYSRAA
ncbi:hypothetical protein JI742_10005 [Piscinibacter sp. Jin2]|uniref:Uncharacterized protein n=1 Tax=Aquariibacter lacus TaxID=2801332 RepID=A0A9X0XHT6_9BURK|nr:hypothetical protein [Piscinibacter lacus]MBL0720223.1 hypothetical protein [Piscinibacter lacus]